MQRLWRSRLLAGIVGLVLGLGAGFTGGLWWTMEGVKAANEVSMLLNVASASENAAREYQFGSPDVGIYALQQLVGTLESYRRYDLEPSTKRALTFDEALSYVRLGVLKERTGEQNGADEAFASALNRFSLAGRDVKDVSELKAILYRLENPIKDVGGDQSVR